MSAPTTPAVTNPGGSSAASSGTSAFAQGFSAGASSNIYANMKTYTNTTSTTQTSPQDIESLVNATMQALVGRNATAQEIQTYGNELLAAEKANFGTFNETTSYGPTGKRADITGGQTSTGIDAQGFLQSLISGSADAQSYKMATGYFDGMTQALQQMKSE
jgi:hypothetical protein